MEVEDIPSLLDELRLVVRRRDAIPEATRGHAELDAEAQQVAERLTLALQRQDQMDLSSPESGATGGPYQPTDGFLPERSEAVA